MLLHGGSRNATGPPAGGGGSSLPNPFSARARREGHELSRLLAPVQRSAVCKVRTSPGPEGPTGRPGRALLDELAVLRRPFHPLRFATGVDLGLSGVDPYTERDWRLARVADGAAFIVVPVRVRPGAGQPGARCLDAQRRALRREARRIPASIRAQTVYLGERELAYVRRVITRPPYDSVCLIETARSSAGADCGSQTPRALRRPSLPELTSGNPLRRAAYVGVVADGVASVTLRVPQASGPRRRDSARISGRQRDRRPRLDRAPASRPASAPDGHLARRGGADHRPCPAARTRLTRVLPPPPPGVPDAAARGNHERERHLGQRARNRDDHDRERNRVRDHHVGGEAADDGRLIAPQAVSEANATLWMSAPVGTRSCDRSAPASVGGDRARATRQVGAAASPAGRERAGGVEAGERERQLRPGLPAVGRAPCSRRRR